MRTRKVALKPPERARPHLAPLRFQIFTDDRLEADPVLATPLGLGRLRVFAECNLGQHRLGRLTGLGGAQNLGRAEQDAARAPCPPVL
jgi:hypothetical protein